MLCSYDLYDLSAVYTIIREKPAYKKNEEVLINILEVFANRQHNHSHNQIRESLQRISNLDKNIYFFVETINIYSYISGFLKEERIYRVLIHATHELLCLIKSKKWVQVVALADCLHNLPIDIAEDKFRFPKNYWHENFAYYRNQCDSLFLKKEELLFY